MAQPAAPGQHAASQGLDAAHRGLLQRKDLQFDFPSFELPKPAAETPGWMKAIGDFFGHIFSALGQAAPYLFWGVVAAAVLAVLFLIAREAGWIEWSRPRRKAKAEAQADHYRPRAETAKALLDDADALAAEGRFAEAVHTLLLRSIEDMRRFRPHSVRPAATSRDLAGLTVLPDQARPAFVSMAETVEASLFGGRDVGAEAYAACRRAYEAFAFAQVWA